MARKKKDPAEKWKSYKKHFENIAGTDNVEDIDVKQFVQNIVQTCANIQHSICEQADIINIDLFEKAKAETTVDEYSINKSVWRDCVNKTVSLRKKPISEKTLAKEEKKSNEMEYIGQLKNILINTYFAGDNKVNIINNFSSKENNEDNLVENDNLLKLMNEAADIKENIKSMYDSYNTYKKAFVYVTQGKYTKKEFKQMVDSVAYGFNEKNKYGEHHVDNAIKFCKTFKCMSEFGYNEFNRIVQENGVYCQVIKNEES